MKPAQIVAKGKQALHEAITEYLAENKPPAGSKDGEGKAVKENPPPPSWERKVVNEFLGGYNLHESFVEAILHEKE